MVEFCFILRYELGLGANIKKEMDYWERIVNPTQLDLLHVFFVLNPKARRCPGVLEMGGDYWEIERQKPPLVSPMGCSMVISINPRVSASSESDLPSKIRGLLAYLHDIPRSC